MKTLFPDTGIHFLGLPFKILPNNFNFEDSDQLLELIDEEWLPISFDGSDRDYSRIKFVGATLNIEGIMQLALSPVIAIDTTTGNPQDGYLTEHADLGQTFKADHINKLLPQANDNYKQWLKKIGQRKDLNLSNNELELYRMFLEEILESLENNGDLTYTDKSIKGFGEFQFRPPATPESINVNLYLDLGNSRSVGLLFEDDPQAQTFATNVTPLKILNYEESFKEGFYYETEDLIFVSAVEFSKPLFNTKFSASKTFKWPSMVKIGKEAQTLASEENKLGTKTGISGPKRYLWDDTPPKDPWYFSEGNKSNKIEGELLKYFANTDPDDFQDNNLPDPPQPKYARRSMLTFFIIEILNQAYRQVNSPEHRDNNRTLRKRRLKRLVCSYPSGYTETLKKRFKKQLEKAVKIFSNYMGLENIIEVDLGLDEASASQVVFLESIIKNYKTNLSKIGKYIFRTDKNSKFRIASIDIGGGTTDIMVSEYDLSSFDTLGGQLKGEIKLLDSTQYGGDDIAKDIIEFFILPQLRKNAGVDNQFFWELFFGQNIVYQHLRTQCLNLILWPLALMIIRPVMGKKDDYAYDPGASVLEFLQESKFCVKKSILINDLAPKLKNHGWDLDDMTMERFIFPSVREVNKVVGDVKKPLLRTLYNYSLVLNAFKPSFVIVSGKLSSLVEMKKLLLLWMPSSPDRVIFLDNFRPGKWYPFLMNDIISDPKTSVAAGLAIADIARNASVDDGCYVNVNMDKNANMNFIGIKTVAADGIPQLSEREILVDINQNSSEEFPLNEKINIVYRNVNNKDIPCNSIYRIGLKEDCLPDQVDPIKMKITRNAEDRTKLEFAFSGTVIKDGNSIIINDSYEETKKENFFEEQVCTILKNEYYLDNPQFVNIY
jgi:hypothetical protein